MPSPLRRCFVLASVLLAGALLPACTTNPTTGRSQFNFYSRDEEIALGMQAKPELIKEFGGEVARADLTGYITEVGMRLARHTEGDGPSLPWEFTLLDSDVINAFALPGGKVFMSRGLAAKMTSEAQLAGVLGHEIGHVTARHTNDRMSQSLLVTVGAVTAAVLLENSDASDATKAVAPLVLQVGGQSIVLQYSRDQESEADSLGLRYMTREGYDPRAQVQVMEILKASMSGERGLEFFSTHPYPETRIKRLNRLLQTDYAQMVNNPNYRTGEQEFRTRFLSKLSEAYPGAGRPRFASSEAELDAMGGRGDLGLFALGAGHPCGQHAK
ncbi:MAG: M48 family metallopeptidase [Phycisphaerales bacterium]|nr:M48 family metallopeptidase [Phycisphaerales bacterium]